MNKYVVNTEKRKKLGEYIKRVREEKKLGMNQLSVKISVTNSLISKLENGLTQKISPFLLKEIAQGLRIDYKELYKIVGYLDEDDCNDVQMTSENEVKFLDVEIIELPVYGKASAGPGYINLGNIVGYKKIINHGFSEDAFVVEITGDSMSTVIDDGDIVVVDPQLKEYIAGKVYVVTYNDETFIKQIQCPKKDLIILKSFNPEYDDKYIVDDNISHLKIEGRVVKVISEKIL